MGDSHETSFKHVCSQLSYKAMMHLQKLTIILKTKMGSFRQT